MIELKKNSIITNNELEAVIGERIRRARLDKHKSQGELAELVGVARQTISGWEKNVANLPLGQLIKIFDALQIPLDEYPIFKNHVHVPDESIFQDKNESVLPSVTAYFDSTANRDQAVNVLSWIDSLSSENTSLLIKLLQKLALRDQAIDDAYRRGVMDATIFCAIRDAKGKDGYEAGIRKVEEEGIDFTLKNIEENIEVIASCEEADDDIGDCSYEAVNELRDKISNRIYESDFQAGEEDAKREYKRDHFDGDWDDV